jgi:5-methylcytosine-specific restriction enzyme A
MPNAPLRHCIEPGCTQLVERGRCPAHQKEQRRDQRRYATGPTHYGLTRWRRLRAAWLAEHPFCVQCGRLAEVVDHVERHMGDPVKFYEGPFNSLCASCHSRKTTGEVR